MVSRKVCGVTLALALLCGCAADIGGVGRDALGAPSDPPTPAPTDDGRQIAAPTPTGTAAPPPTPASPTPTDHGRQVAAPTPAPTPVPVITIRIAAAGDCTIGSYPEAQTGRTFFDVFERNGRDYGYFFAQSPHLRDADLSIVNFEGTLTIQTTPAPGRRWHFRAPPEFVQVLTRGGIGAVSVANNHIGDYGRTGQSETVQTLKDAGIAVHGAGMAALVERQGVLIGLLGYDNLNSTGVRASAILELAREEITELRGQGAAIVIVSVHWGLEYVIEPTANQQTLGRGLIDAGADLILGTHPHIWQGIERYNDRYIVYSMGNYVFGGNTQQRGGRLEPDTGILLAAFDVLDGDVQDVRLGLAPYRQSLDGNWNLYQPHPLTGEDVARVTQMFLDRSALIQGGITEFSWNGA